MFSLDRSLQYCTVVKVNCFLTSTVAVFMSFYLILNVTIYVYYWRCDIIYVQSKTPKSLPHLLTQRWGLKFFWMTGSLNYHWQRIHEGLWCMVVCVCFVSDSFALPSSRRTTGLVSGSTERVVGFSWFVMLLCGVWCSLSIICS